MGVDISLVRLTPVKVSILDDSEEDDYSQPYVISGCERSLLPSETIWFKDEDRQDIADIFSCAYSTYNKWRNWLSVEGLGQEAVEIHRKGEMLYEGESYPNGLWHIINFSDSEGYIGPAALAELLPALKMVVPKPLEDDRYHDRFKDMLDDMVARLEHAKYTYNFENIYLRYS